MAGGILAPSRAYLRTSWFLRGLALVGHFAVRSGWDLRDRGKSVWAEIEVPKPTPAIRAAVLRRFFAVRSQREAGPMPHPLVLSAA